jgi:hypothetical protein
MIDTQTLFSHMQRDAKRRTLSQLVRIFSGVVGIVHRKLAVHRPLASVLQIENDTMLLMGLFRGGCILLVRGAGGSTTDLPITEPVENC